MHPFSSLYAWLQIKQRLAKVAHLVEHDLAKVGVAGSSPVFRSGNPSSIGGGIFFGSPGGGIGRHAGLKILWTAMSVTVQLRSGAQKLKAIHENESLFLFILRSICEVVFVDLKQKKLNGNRYKMS